MNKILTSFNTFALILLFFSFVFSVFSISTLKVDETQSIKVNFYELIEIAEQPKRLSGAKPKETIQEADLNKAEENSEVKKSLYFEKYKLNKPDIKRELSKIKLSKEREVILKISAIIQDKISSVWIKPNSLSKVLAAKVLINLAPSGEVINFEMVEPSNDKVFDESVLIAINKISFFEEVLGLDRKLFESNFRNFKLVFKSSGEIE
tara:strand:- start:392 stop:1012 length:621 start_codon:yes stop_codon:yes gene_type:complete